MQTAPFNPFGPTYAIDDSAASQCPSTNNDRPTAYRIVNTASAYGYVAWAPTAAGVINTAPVVGTPQGGKNGGGIVGLPAGRVEYLSLPPEAFFKASTAGTLEITPGEGGV